jgi:hypothetical protein
MTKQMQSQECWLACNITNAKQHSTCIALACQISVALTLTIGLQRFTLHTSPALPCHNQDSTLHRVTSRITDCRFASMLVSIPDI